MRDQRFLEVVSVVMIVVIVANTMVVVTAMMIFNHCDAPCSKSNMSNRSPIAGIFVGTHRFF
jgi:hypothetical protein